MADTSRGLGRGLDALLGGSSRNEHINPSEVRSLAIESVVPNKHQPRSEFSEEALEDLSASIKAQGVLQPILVRPLAGGSFELVAGERRLRASKRAGLNEIPALVREMTDEQSLAIALIENLQREDLNAIEEAKGYKQLQDEFGLSQQDLATQVGKSRSAVANALRLLNLSDSMQESIASGALTAGHGRALMAIEDKAGRDELHMRIAELGLSVRQAEAETVYFKKNQQFPESGSAPAKATGTKKRPTPTGGAKDSSGSLEAIADALEQKYGLKVQTAGTSVRGKITFQFANEEELKTLVEALGVKQKMNA